MGDLRVEINEYNDNDTSIVSVDLGTCDLSCSHVNGLSSNIDGSSVSELEVSDISNARHTLESQSLSIESTNITGSNVHVICGSVGELGDGIKKITAEYSDEDDGYNIVEITLQSGEKTTVKIKNGSAGSKGDQGEKGDAFTYEDFTEEQLEGLKGPAGADGPEGPQGIPGTGAITSLNEYTLAEYMDMKNRGLLNNSFYTVYKNGELYRMYLGETLVAKKAESGEQVTLGMAYPLVFPIIFA